MYLFQPDGRFATELARIRAISRPGHPPAVEPWTKKAWERERERREMKQRKRRAAR